MSDGTTTTTNCCPECNSQVDWDTSSWCPSCGYYPAINFRSDGEQDGHFQDEVIYDHWWEVVPGWLWSVLAGTCLIVLFSGAVRVMFADSQIRVWWTIGQTVGGLVAMGTVHFMAYLYSASRSDKLGPLDMFTRPLATWQPVLNNLPESSNLVCWSAFSVTAILSGYFVVGGIDASEVIRQQATAHQRERMRQQAEEQEENAGKPRRSPMCVAISTAAAIAQAQQAACGGVPVPSTIEEALGAFAGDAGMDRMMTTYGTGRGELSLAERHLSPVSFNDPSIPETIRRDSLPPTQPQRSTNSFQDRKNGTSRPGTRNSSSPTGDGPTGGSSDGEKSEVECLILGYTTNATGDIRSVLLAAAPDRKLLRFVGKIPAEQVAPDVLNTLLLKFEEIPAPRPMVRCPYGGRWIQPELFCLASYEGWSANGRLHNADVTRLMNTRDD